jgi:hypothetical protein
LADRADVLSEAFARADMNELQAAIASGDLNRIAASLDLPPSELEGLIDFLFAKASELRAEFPELSQAPTR